MVAPSDVQEAREPVEQVQEEAWRPWVPWAIGVGLMAVGAALGWLSGSVALEPWAPEREVQPKTTPVVSQGSRAKASLPAPRRERGRVGEQVEVTWRVRNTGDLPWTVDRFRFAPRDVWAPVISLPRTVEPGQAVRVRARLTIPPAGAFWKPVWVLTGKDGPVPGGEITAVVGIAGTQPVGGRPVLH